MNIKEKRLLTEMEMDDKIREDNNFDECWTWDNTDAMLTFGHFDSYGCITRNLKSAKEAYRFYLKNTEELGGFYNATRLCFDIINSRIDNLYKNLRE